MNLILFVVAFCRSGRVFFPLTALVWSLLLAGCAVRNTTPPAGQVQDLMTFPQDLTVYATAVGADQPLLAAHVQTAQNQRFDRLFFNPWRASKASIPASDAFSLLRRGPTGYAENLLPWQKQRWADLEAEADAAAYPSRAQKALTVVRTSLRELPTDLPRFAHPDAPGQGFPFDLTQISALPPGMPLLVTHRSRNKAWLYVETALAGGWVPAGDVAMADPAVQQSYRNGRYAAVLRDGVPLYDESGRLLVSADLGTVFPVKEVRTDGSLLVLVPERDMQGNAQLTPCPLAPSEAALKPLPLTAGKLAALGNPLLGQPYGWGGLFGNRDCSALLRDLFTPFGIWLPRNSAAQAKAWNYKPFGNLSAAAKEQRILSEGVPFATLLWLRGHIALYIGDYKGRAAMFHNMWGVRTQAGGRHIVGRAVITSTRPGTELPEIEDRAGLLNRMQGMSVLQ